MSSVNRCPHCGSLVWQPGCPNMGWHIRRAWNDRIDRPDGIALAAERLALAATPDPTNPDHYARLDPQPLDVIEAWKLPFSVGNVVKYIACYRYKGDPIGDLRKAREYLDREIARMEREGRR